MAATKVYLVKNKQVRFGDAVHTTSYGSVRSYQRSVMIYNATLDRTIPAYPIDQEIGPSDDVKAAFAEIDLKISISGTKDIFDGGALKNERLDITSVLLFQQPSEISRQDIQMKAKLSNFRYKILGDSRNEGGVWTSSPQYMNIMDNKKFQPPLIYVDESVRFFPLPAKVWQNNSYAFFGDLTISLKVKRQNVPLPGFSINQRILEGGAFSDVVIVANNGAELKCHKNFLSAHSSVFQAMFESNMIEGQTSRVEMIDMAEESMKAFLAYLYYGDFSDAEKDCAIAFELLWAGHKYDIQKLEVSMMDLLLSKDVNWYTVDAALRLFLFTRNLELEKAGQLITKAVQVMKKNFSDLEASTEYQQLFKMDPVATMLLCKLAFSLKNEQ